MDFAKLSEWIGFGEAVLVADSAGKLPNSVISSASFEQWLQVWQSSPSGSDLKQLALSKLGQLATSFEQWYLVWGSSPSDSDLKQLALSKLGQLDASFEQWLQVWQSSPSGSDLEQLALSKLGQYLD